MSCHAHFTLNYIVKCFILPCFDYVSLCFVYYHSLSVIPHSEEDEQDDPLDRSILKASSMKNMKAAEKKAAKEIKSKLDLLNAAK